jgi:2-polyprenyl-3-methyl-5-hydroxy-6-metoxy-1,4-benzoquinol methylase
LSNLKVRKACSLCECKKLINVFSFGKSPLANNLVKSKVKQKIYPLKVVTCSSCNHLQLKHIINSKILFSKYLYTTSVSEEFVFHFKNYAKDIKKNFFNKNINNNNLLDIGSNDGCFLKELRNYKITSYGVEPAKNLHKICKAQGLTVFNDFFDKIFVKKLKKKKLFFKAITANNVFAHIDNLNSVVKNIKKLLTNDGVFVFEVSYLKDVIEKKIFDTFYHEHLSYHSLEPLDKFFKKHSMIIFDIKRVKTHGGSIRVYVSNDKNKKTKQAVINLLNKEKISSLNSIDNIRLFFKNVTILKKNIAQFLNRIIKNKENLIGYGAPAKAVTILNYCNISGGAIKYIVEDSKIKQGYFMPNFMIPIVSKQTLIKNNINFKFVVIFAWNYYKKILSNNINFFKNKKVYVLLPKLRRVNK